MNHNWVEPIQQFDDGARRSTLDDKTPSLRSTPWNLTPINRANPLKLQERMIIRTETSFTAARGDIG